MAPLAQGLGFRSYLKHAVCSRSIFGLLAIIMILITLAFSIDAASGQGSIDFLTKLQSTGAECEIVYELDADGVPTKTATGWFLDQGSVKVDDPTESVNFNWGDKTTDHHDKIIKNINEDGTKSYKTYWDVTQDRFNSLNDPHKDALLTTHQGTKEGCNDYFTSLIKRVTASQLVTEVMGYTTAGLGLISTVVNNQFEKKEHKKHVKNIISRQKRSIDNPKGKIRYRKNIDKYIEDQAQEMFNSYELNQKCNGVSAGLMLAIAVMMIICGLICHSVNLGPNFGEHNAIFQTMCIQGFAFISVYCGAYFLAKRNLDKTQLEKAKEIATMRQEFHQKSKPDELTPTSEMTAAYEQSTTNVLPSQGPGSMQTVTKQPTNMLEIIEQQKEQLAQQAKLLAKQAEEQEQFKETFFRGMVNVNNQLRKKRGTGNDVEVGESVDDASKSRCVKVGTIKSYREGAVPGPPAAPRRARRLLRPINKLMNRF